MNRQHKVSCVPRLTSVTPCFLMMAFQPLQSERRDCNACSKPDLRPFIENPFRACKYWFEPVLPARLIVALLEAATSPSLSESLRDACKQSAVDISRTFGIVPRLQKTATPDVLLVLEHELARALYGDLDLSLIWHTVKVYHGGKI